VALRDISFVKRLHWACSVSTRRSSSRSDHFRYSCFFSQLS